MVASTASPAASSPAAASRRARAAIIILGVVLVAWHNGFSGEFVLDDFSSIVDNASIRQLWPPGPVLAPPAEAGVGGRPLANLTFALNYAIGRLAPEIYRATNILLHGLAAFTLYGVVRRTLSQPILRRRFGACAAPLALAVAVLWAAHPLTTAAVDYASQRTELLMALACLLTLYAFIRAAETAHPPADGGRLWRSAGTLPAFRSSHGQGARATGAQQQPATGKRSAAETAGRSWFALSIAACLAGMASKETMVTAPLLVFLYDRTFVAGSFRQAWRVRRHYYVALAATWLALAWLMTGSPVTERGVGFGLGVTAADYALTQCHALLHYLQLGLWPAPLVFDHGWTVTQSLRTAAPALVACGTLLAAVVVALRRSPAAGFAGVWFFLILAPTTSVVPIIQQPIAESRAYLPLAGIVALVVLGAFHVLRQLPRAALALGLAAAVAFGAATVRRHADYRTEIALWTDTVAKRPANARAHGNLGAALLRAGRTRESLTASASATRLAPSYAEAHNNQGVALARLGQPAAALEAYRAALAARPRFADAHYNLADLFATTARTSDARRHFEIARQLRPQHAKTLNNLSVVVLQLGDAPSAAAHARAALQLEPRLAEAHYNLGNALTASGDFAGAIAAYEAARRHDPRFARAEHNLGVLKLKTGRTAEAIAHFETALRLDPDYAEARRLLALARQPR